MTVRAAGLAVIVILIFVGGIFAQSKGGESVVLIDFATETEAWPNIDDAVMGGVSASSMAVVDGFATFQGEVSFENNGGFASVRSRPQSRDLSAFEGLVLRVRGDGKRYGFRIRTSEAFDGVSYQATIQPPAGGWQDIEIAFDEMVPVFRGRKVADHPPLDPARVTTLGFIVSRQEGRFRLDIASIRAY